MYTLQVVEANENEPVTLEELKLHLRLNDDSEDDMLTEMITVSRQFFEHLTSRSVMETTYRQFLPKLVNQIHIMKSPTISIEKIMYYDEVGDEIEIEDYAKRLWSEPALIFLDTLPTTHNLMGGYVEFVSGYEEENIPKDIKQGIKLLAAHYYEYRNSNLEVELKTLPMGFQAICNKYKVGAVGSWGM